MTIKCLSLDFIVSLPLLSSLYPSTPPSLVSLFLSLSYLYLLPRSLSLFSFYAPLYLSHPLSLLRSLHLYSAAFVQIKLRLGFSPSQSTYLCFMTRTKSILCCYWFFSLLLLPSCLNRHKTILPFTPLFLLTPSSWWPYVRLGQRCATGWVGEGGGGAFGGRGDGWSWKPSQRRYLHYIKQQWAVRPTDTKQTPCNQKVAG